MKKIFCIAGIAGACYGSYEIGKVVGVIKTGKFVLNATEELFPGTKRYVAKRASEKITDIIFGSEEDQEED